MVRSLFILPALLFMLASYAQDSLPRLLLVNQHRPSKKINLKNDRDSYFITATGKYNGEIISATDSSFRIERYYKNGKDSMYTQKVRFSHRHPEGLKIKKLSLYTRDTVELLLKDILVVRKPWFNNRGWMLIPAYFLGGAILAVPLLPVAAITNGSAGVRNWLQFEALLLGLSGPSLFIGTRHRKFALGEKWKLVLQ
jgi:hypothetical protein